MSEFAKEVLSVNLEDEMRRSYLDYAMSVIVGRALPDARDGLKPVHRRSLFAMNEQGNHYNKPFRKSARIVGDVMGKYHPHGDTAIYDTIVRMAQPFSLRYMLVDGQGNFGSVDGDRPAAMRYTEVRMSKIAMELVADIDKDTVDFVPNYDGSEQEPAVLPTRIPNLLVNGSSGIAVGMATNIPPHNLSEVIDACVALIDNPDMDLAALMKLVPAPDFPTAGLILDAAGLKEAYETGRGRIVLRARTHFEDFERGGDRQDLAIVAHAHPLDDMQLVGMSQAVAADQPGDTDPEPAEQDEHPDEEAHDLAGRLERRDAVGQLRVDLEQRVARGHGDRLGAAARPHEREGAHAPDPRPVEREVGRARAEPEPAAQRGRAQDDVDGLRIQVAHDCRVPGRAAGVTQAEFRVDDDAGRRIEHGLRHARPRRDRAPPVGRGAGVPARRAPAALRQ